MRRQSAEQSRIQNAIWSVWVIALVLFSCACFLPIFGSSSNPMPGYVALLIGWLLLASIYGLLWLPNPLLIFGLILLSKRYTTGALIVGVMSFGLSLIWWLVDPEPLIGYYFWAASMLTLAVGAFIIRRMIGPDIRDLNWWTTRQQ